MRRSAPTLAVLLLAAAPAASARVGRYLTGDPADASPAPAGPVLLLAGGGDDLDAAFRRTIDLVRGCADCAAKIDVVVLRASGADGYNDYLAAMPGVDSVETLVLGARRDAERADVLAAVRAAELVFFAGGDQCKYVRRIRGTALEREVEAVHARGGGVGGTSAGLAIQGARVYDGCTGSVVSDEALSDPYHRKVHFSGAFFAWPGFEAVLTDSHLSERNRLGRLLAFVSRRNRELPGVSTLGLGVDGRTAVVVDRHGRGEVFGEGSAWLVETDQAAEVCRPGRPLTHRGFRIGRVGAGASFPLDGEVHGEPSVVDVVEGALVPRP